MAFCVLLLTQCTGPKLVTSDIKDSTSVIQTIKPDSTILAPDSTLFYALFRCDSMGKVYIASLNEHKTDGVKTETSFNNGIFNYSTVRPKKIIITYTINNVTTIRRQEKTTVTVTIIKMNLFQKIFFWIGLGSLLIFIVMLYYKFK